MASRKLITISLPPLLLKKATELAKEENRTKSELLREALRFYVETKEIRRTTARERLLDLLDQVQARTKGIPPQQIRKIIREGVEATRRQSRRASAEGRPRY
jgi:predicted transcriptional regulator